MRTAAPRSRGEFREARASLLGSAHPGLRARGDPLLQPRVQARVSARTATSRRAAGRRPPRAARRRYQVCASSSPRSTTGTERATASAPPMTQPAARASQPAVGIRRQQPALQHVLRLEVRALAIGRGDRHHRREHALAVPGVRVCSAGCSAKPSSMARSPGSIGASSALRCARRSRSNSGTTACSGRAPRAGLSTRSAAAGPQPRPARCPVRPAPRRPRRVR